MAEHDNAVWLHAEHRVTLIELSECSGLAEGVLRELVEFGALAPAAPGTLQFNARCVASVRTAARLTRDLELDTQALALVLSFLDRIDALETRVRELNAKLPR